METEILVIGSGIAGLTAAIKLAESGFQVTVVTKSLLPSESNSYYAQGGIVYNKYEKGPEGLVRDIINAGSHLVKPSVAEMVSKEGYRHIDNLLVRKAKVPFRKEHGRFLLTHEAAHSRRRILFAYDTTGRYIIEGLLKVAGKTRNIRFMSGAIAIDILTRDHHTDDLMAIYEKPQALGAYVYDTSSREVTKVTSKVTILATGGIGKIYRHTTNPDCATGDGIAMAARAGANVINMEYTQFHPTTLFTHSEQNFLLSESLRGEGGVLVNQNGKEFIKHPKGSLAPRDAVAIEIHNELTATRREFVYLDLSRIDRAKIRTRFPAIYEECLKNNIDITRDRIPVVPAFHFSCGGIRVNEWGRTSITNLFAAGECTCTGLHGANRLASMSLLEGLTFGTRVAGYITRNRKATLNQKLPKAREWVSGKVKDRSDPALLKQDWTSLKNTMWNYVGIVRTARRLDRAMTDLSNLNFGIEDFYRNTVVNKDIIELRNAVQTGLLIAQAAWRNKTSRGCHYRID
jgi:L-aspartate oxidase